MNQTSPPTASLLVDGKYQLVRRIGQGGMGSVWEARHSSLNKRVAIKFIESEYARSPEARARFDREARAAASIQSRHAIEIVDHGITDDGKPYIVMEFLSGEPLDKRIEAAGKLPLQDTARILQQVCRALSRAHGQGIVHRDLTPENIFLVRSPDDDEEIAKVLDFGIAKVQAPEGSQGLTSSTKTGAVLGTPYYMSPEQARGLRNVDHRTDIWSLGVIAFRAVTGQLPFEGESVGDLLVKICTSPVPVPSHVTPGLPPAFDAWFARALDRDPAGRFATVQESAEALAQAAGITVRRASTGWESGNVSAHSPSSVPVTQTAALPHSFTPQGIVAVSGNSGTSAPITTNAIPVNGASRGLLLGLAAAMLVVGGVAGLALFVKLRPHADPGGKDGLVVSPPPPPPMSALSTLPVASASPVASAEPVAPLPVSTGVRPRPGAFTKGKPSASVAPSAAPPLPPPAPVASANHSPPPVPTPAPKKPGKDDPGY